MEKNYIQTILTASNAVKILTDISEKLRQMSKQDSYNQELEEKLVHELVDNARVAMTILPTAITIYKSLDYGDDFDRNTLGEKIDNASKSLEIINSIVSVENAYAALVDGPEWMKFDKYEGEFEFSSIKTLIMSNIYSLNRAIVNINEHVITKTPEKAYLKLNSIADKVAKVADVKDITSLYNTLSTSKGLTAENENIKADIRSILGLVDGKLLLSRKLNMSEIDALKTQALVQFQLAAKLKYVHSFTIDCLQKDQELITEVAKNLELEAVDAGVTLDCEFTTLYPRLFPREVNLLNGDITLSGDYTNDIKEVPEYLANSNVFKNGMIRTNEDMSILLEGLFKTYLKAESMAPVRDVIKNADLDTTYKLLVASSIAVTLVMGEIMSNRYESEAINKTPSLFSIYDQNRSVIDLILKRTFETNPETNTFKVLENDLLKCSLNNMIKRKQIISRSADRLVNSLTTDFETDPESCHNSIIIACRIAALL